MKRVVNIKVCGRGTHGGVLAALLQRTVSYRNHIGTRPLRRLPIVSCVRVWQDHAMQNGSIAAQCAHSYMPLSLILHHRPIPITQSFRRNLSATPFIHLYLFLIRNKHAITILLLLYCTVIPIIFKNRSTGYISTTTQVSKKIELISFLSLRLHYCTDWRQFQRMQPCTHS